MFEPEVLSIAAATQRAAYGDGALSVSTILTKLGQSGRTVLTGPGIDTRGSYLNDDAAAFAAIKDGTLLLSIRGSNSETGALPDTDGLGETLVDCYFSTAFGPQAHAEKLIGLTGNICCNIVASAYASNINLTSQSVDPQVLIFLAIQEPTQLLGSGNALPKICTVLFGDPRISKYIINICKNDKNHIFGTPANLECWGASCRP